MTAVVLLLPDGRQCGRGEVREYPGGGLPPFVWLTGPAGNPWYLLLEPGDDKPRAYRRELWVAWILETTPWKLTDAVPVLNLRWDET